MREVRLLLEKSGVPFTLDAPLHNLTIWKIGGPCDLLVSPRSAEEVSKCVRIFNSTGTP